MTVAAIPIPLTAICCVALAISAITGTLWFDSLGRTSAARGPDGPSAAPCPSSSIDGASVCFFRNHSG